MSSKSERKEQPFLKRVLSVEQEDLLDIYLDSLDNFMEVIKESEKLQVEIETLHLKRILTK